MNKMIIGERGEINKYLDDNYEYDEIVGIIYKNSTDKKVKNNKDVPLFAIDEDLYNIIIKGVKDFKINIYYTNTDIKKMELKLMIIVSGICVKYF